ncbi:MAG: leucine-rich repeat domain-containing protein, partial [Solobacterium sp.]|nr:leucine-rich repeat domain-containing protein [Solobacterium sp.]
MISIGDYNFDCGNYNSNVSSVSLPSTLIRIGSHAFDGCKQITSIIIPQDISSIDSNAFGDCPNLSVVYYSGTKEEWDNKTIHFTAFPSTATIHTSEHNPGEAVRENEVAATCSTEGSYDEVIRCTDCGEIISSIHKTIPALNHTLTKEDTVAASCTQPGHIEGWTCGNCNKHFTDETGNIEITEESWVIPPNHNWRAWSQTTAPTCTEKGVQTRTCSNCDASETEEIQATGHNFEHHDAEPATCTTAGNSEYWICGTCGNCFSDAEGNTKITANSWVINKLGHNMTPNPAVAATCTTAGNSAYWSCDRCNKYFSDADGENEIGENSWIINKLRHSLISHPAVVATCTTAGNSEYWTCETCGKHFSDAEGNTEISANSWIINKLGHNMTAHSAADATCTTAGNSAYWSCDQCQKHFSDEKGNNEIEADSWKIGALGHDMTGHSAVDATCTTAGNSAYWSCGRCGKYFNDAEGNTEIAADSWVISATGHSWSAWSQTTAPTCTEKGEEKRTCSNCDAYETKEIPAAGHALTKT